MIANSVIKHTIRSMSRTLNINSNILLRNIVFDLFLEKLSLSSYVNYFIIKGGFLVSSITNINLRTTMDLDITLKSLHVEKQNLTRCIKEILNIKTKDNLIMELIDIDYIRDDDNYPGLRASISVFFEGLKEVIKIDFTTGDALTPSETNFDYKTLIEGKILNLKSYTIETLLAEKLETILSRGILNTRMRDFYDVFILSKLKLREIDLMTLQHAFIKTASHRKTMNTIQSSEITILNSIEKDQRIQNLWSRYQMNYPYAKDIEWHLMIEEIKEFVKTISIQ